VFEDTLSSDIIDFDSQVRDFVRQRKQKRNLGIWDWIWKKQYNENNHEYW